MNPRDPGLANERSLLAWQRTALSLAVASIVLLRLTLGRLGAIAVVGGGLAFALSTWVFLESQLRYSQAAGIRDRSRKRGGRAAASLAVATVVLATIELLVVIQA